MKKIISIALVIAALSFTQTYAFGEYTIQFIGSTRTMGYFPNYSSCAQYLQQWTNAGGRGGMCIMAND